MQGPSREALAGARERLDALVDGGTDAAALGRLAESLFAFARLLAAQPRLRRALSDPALPAEQKTGLIRSLLGDRVGAGALETVDGLATARWSVVGDLVMAVEALAVQAALTVAQSEGALDDVEDELFRFQRIIEQHPTLRAALTDTGVAVEHRVDLLGAVLADKVRPVTLQLLEEVVRAPRGRSIERVVDELTVAAAQRRQRLLAEARTAVPLTEEQTRRLTATLRRLVGRDVQLQVSVDPEVIGGLSIRFGDEVIEGSIADRIAQARQRLAS